MLMVLFSVLRQLTFYPLYFTLSHDRVVYEQIRPSVTAGDHVITVPTTGMTTADYQPLSYDNGPVGSLSNFAEP